jgi:hypothetical protein
MRFAIVRMRDPACQGMGETLGGGSLTAGHPGRSLAMIQSWQLHAEGSLASRAVRPVMSPLLPAAECWRRPDETQRVLREQEFI